MPTPLLTEFWENEKKKLLAALLPAIEERAIAGAQAGKAKLRQAGIIFDDELANAAAARWAREYAGKLVELMSGTSQKTIGEIVANWIETPGSTMGDLTERLTPLVEGNTDRAFMVATTETTACYAQGEAIVYQSLGIPRAVFLPPGHPRCRCWTSVKRLKSGELVVVWLTNRDEVVCRTPIQTPWGRVKGCRAMHNVVISEGPYLGRKVSEIG